jgi:hypothetical protein
VGINMLWIRCFFVVIGIVLCWSRGVSCPNIWFALLPVMPVRFYKKIPGQPVLKNPENPRFLKCILFWGNYGVYMPYYVGYQFNQINNEYAIIYWTTFNII